MRLKQTCSFYANNENDSIDETSHLSTKNNPIQKIAKLQGGFTLYALYKHQITSQSGILFVQMRIQRYIQQLTSITS